MINTRSELSQPQSTNNFGAKKFGRRFSNPANMFAKTNRFIEGENVVRDTHALEYPHNKTRDLSFG